MPRPTRPSPKKEPSEIQRLLVMVEAMQGDIRRVAEGHDSLRREMEQLRQELSHRMDDLENRMDLGFQSIRQELNQLKQELAQVKQELAQVKQAVSEIDRKLEAHLQTHPT